MNGKAELTQKEKFPFDDVAGSYDSEFTLSVIGRMQRKRVYYFLEKVLPGKQLLEILEINCGTGEDAIWLAKKGHEVIATDASEKMIEVANAKRPLQNTVFEKCAFVELKNKFSGRKFDLIFSNFGGLNCVNESELKVMSHNFSSLLNPNGKFIAVVMGRKCLWEIFYFTFKLNFKNAFRRLRKKGVDAVIGFDLQKTFYYSPSEFKKITESEFNFTMSKPIGIAIPASYLEPFFKNKKGLLNILNFTERFFSFSFLSDFSDHYFMVMEKK